MKTEETCEEEKSLLLIVDVQNDFCPEGSLAVPCGDKVIPPLNKLIKAFHKKNRLIVATRDWHLEKTTHFDKWPPHCIRHTKGAEFHPDLELPIETAVASKGFFENEDAYSAFDGFVVESHYEPDGEWYEERPLELAAFLKKKNINTVYVGGLATDYCVKATVLDALKLGFKTFLLKDACRAVNIKKGDGPRAITEMKKAGAAVISTKEALKK